MPHLDRVIVWARVDGGVSITHLHSDDMLPGEPEDDFIPRYIDKIKNAPHLLGAVVTVVPSAQIPKDKSQRDQWSVNGGKVEVDSAKVAVREQKKAERDAVLQKINLSESEADIIFKREPVKGDVTNEKTKKVK